jgi:hypothetical protein
MEQISPEIIERSVQSFQECQMVGGGQFQHLHYILLLTLDVCRFCLSSIKTFKLKIKLNFSIKICDFLKKIVM